MHQGPRQGAKRGMADRPHAGAIAERWLSTIGDLTPGRSDRMGLGVDDCVGRQQVQELANGDRRLNFGVRRARGASSVHPRGSARVHRLTAADGSRPRQRKAE